MCGIVGYIGKEQATPILLDGLRRLEYRGYDSAGIAVIGEKGVTLRRTEGKLKKLEDLVASEKIDGVLGVGHTRWATHGRPSEANAHPHRFGNIIVVHNGIIENYMELRKFLGDAGHKFSSETDSEVISHLIEYYQRKNSGTTLDAVRQTLSKLRGSYALVILNVEEADRFYVVKKGSPLVVGEREGEAFVASDIPALLPYTKDVRFLEDGDYAVLSKTGAEIFDEAGKKIERKVHHIPWTPIMAERGGYKHFMLKEIFEQAHVMEDSMAGRLDQLNGKVVLDEISALFDGNKPKFDRISIIACGTSWHAGKVGKYLIESLARIPVSVDLASEFRYREPLIDNRTLVLSITQSGETADTLAAQTMAKELGALTLAVCNVVGSSISRHAMATLYTFAGPEIGVASTKAFTAQLVVLYLFALNLAHRVGKIDSSFLSKQVAEMACLPRFMKDVLENAPAIRDIAEQIADAPHVLFIGRGANFPVALEGALKLKEISYVHAEGFAGGELKHGPIALIDHGIPVVSIVPKDSTYEKIISNIEEVRARGASIVALATADDKYIKEKAEYVIYLPKTSWYITPILAAVPLQLLAYYVADHKGTDVDQPRNLAKSVTVE